MPNRNNSLFVSTSPGYHEQQMVYCLANILSSPQTVITRTVYEILCQAPPTMCLLGITARDQISQTFPLHICILQTMEDCSPIASASAVAPRLHPLRLLLLDCVRFGCCSSIESTSTAAPASRAAPRLCPLSMLLTFDYRYCILSCSRSFQLAHANVLEHSSRSSRFIGTKVAHH